MLVDTADALVAQAPQAAAGGRVAVGYSRQTPLSLLLPNQNPNKSVTDNKQTTNATLKQGARVPMGIAIRLAITPIRLQSGDCNPDCQPGRAARIAIWIAIVAIRIAILFYLEFIDIDGWILIYSVLIIPGLLVSVYNSIWWCHCLLS